ncbi:ribosomal protein S18 acetylase RimI-like enzyme [Massilia umbonata]|uniref:Ribosomal protein S18 acetylase RimI-like enzyme n=1 Tax=Pseudoduganella umbonata TaxID=864828 RepID=A0A7W5EB42_9BURK|nr:ribosomal protein S18 acetylase RimI-like enzyme [Pseudoduganella umbonata]
MLRIQLACYGHGFIENAEVYARRLASPLNCSLVCEIDGQPCGYLAAYRSRHGKVTPLHGDFAGAHGEPDTLYLHDMAVLPSHAGRGLARALLERMWAIGSAARLHRSALVSVQDSQGYWARNGYTPQPVHDAVERSRLASYGDGAVYMVRALSTR